MAGPVVRVWEARVDVEPGPEWLLLTDLSVTELAQVQALVQQYASRWLIEDFHKALKTGLGAKRLQLQTAARLFAAVALLSLVALALVALRECSRQQRGALAEVAGLSVSYLRVLRSQRKHPLETVWGVCYALGRAGRAPSPGGYGPLRAYEPQEAATQYRFSVLELEAYGTPLALSPVAGPNWNRNTRWASAWTYSAAARPAMQPSAPEAAMSAQISNGNGKQPCACRKTKRARTPRKAAQ